MPQAFVAGTWRAEKASAFSGDARLLGRRIAEAGFDLACGPGTGIARHVVDGYRGVEQRGSVTFYLPRRELMDAVGEVVEPGYDRLESTEFDYPMRNVWQVGRSDCVFVITGGDGALEEILPALIDYHLPVGVVPDSGPAATAIARLIDLFPEWIDLLVFDHNVDQLASAVMARVKKSVADE